MWCIPPHLFLTILNYLLILTHCGQQEMDNTLQITFSNAFSWMKIVVFWLTWLTRSQRVNINITCYDVLVILSDQNKFPLAHCDSDQVIKHQRRPIVEFYIPKYFFTQPTIRFDMISNYFFTLTKTVNYPKVYSEESIFKTIDKKLCTEVLIV